LSQHKRTLLLAYRIYTDTLFFQGNTVISTEACNSFNIGFLNLTLYQNLYIMKKPVLSFIFVCLCSIIYSQDNKFSKNVVIGVLTNVGINQPVSFSSSWIWFKFRGRERISNFKLSV